jgi:tight adherence protein C
MNMPVLIFVVLFASVAGLIVGGWLWLTRDDALGRRLARLQEQPAELDKTAEAAHEWKATFVQLAEPIARLSAPKEGGSASYLRIRFMNAGLRQPYWPVLFFAAKSLLALLLPGLFLGYGGLVGGVSMTPAAVLAMLLLSGLGYYLPNLLLLSMIRHRQRELDEALPDAIDLMTVCVEAGLAIDAALRRTCEELDLRSPVLAEELRLVSLELQVGASRESAMHNLSLRTGVDDVASFVTILLQSEHFGTNVADSLRTLSETMRESRRLRAEELAAKIPLKMLFPMIFFIFPALFVVLLGPALISVFRTLLPTMGGNG